MGTQVRARDALLPAAIAGVAVLELASIDVDGRAAAGVLEVLACALLVVRRRWPLVSGTGALLLAASPPWVGPAADEVSSVLLIVFLACFTLGRWVPGLAGLAAFPLVLVDVLGVYLVTDARDHGLGDVVFVAALLVPPYLVGRIARRLADHNDLLQRQQELVRREAVRAERDRIARELHDVIAHSVSAMVVQVAAVQDLVRSDPARAEEMLARVADTGRRAIAETGRLLHVIRDADDELGLAPAPGLHDLDDLVREFERDGLEVELVVDGLPEQVSAAVDVSAYRVVREALTNALRYAPDRRVRVEVAGTDAGLTIRTVNRVGASSGVGSGLGLAGLTERVEMLGGTVRHGSTPAGEFELVASVPA
ncbi:sensor histidine kinase [Nocardioides sp.]|uniref:sensor histidine kinase n=1 Tax=Nocardioides sp. TaxID=35761 RepID=UPI0037852B63